MAASSKFSTKQLTLANQWSYPITEYQYLQAGVSANKNELVVSQGYSAQQAVDWVKDNGNTFERQLEDTNGDGVINSLDSPYTVYGTDFYTYELTAGWNFDTRNRAIFADRGFHLAVSGRYALPLSTVRYYASNFQYLQYIPLWQHWLLSFNSTLDYAEPLGKTTALPPYLNYFAGGPDSVRGFRESTLGPKGQHRHRQPLWRQFAGGRSPGADIPGARQVEERRPGQLVLRHGQRFPDRQQGASSWAKMTLRRSITTSVMIT